MEMNGLFMELIMIYVIVLHDHQVKYVHNFLEIFIQQYVQCKLLKKFNVLIIIQMSHINKLFIVNQINMTNPDENKFFGGFIPVWALTLFVIAIVFVIIFIAGLICHFAGCRRSSKDRTNNTDSLFVEQALIAENNQLQTTSIKSDKLTEKIIDDSF